MPVCVAPHSEPAARLTRDYSRRKQTINSRFGPGDGVAYRAVHHHVTQLYDEREEEKEQEVLKKPRKKSRIRDEGESDVLEKKERKKTKDKDTGSSARLQDVTNSPRRRRAAATTVMDSNNDGKSTVLTLHMFYWSDH